MALIFDIHHEHVNYDIYKLFLKNDIQTSGDKLSAFAVMMVINTYITMIMVISSAPGGQVIVGISAINHCYGIGSFNCGP